MERLPGFFIQSTACFLLFIGAAAAFVVQSAVAVAVGSLLSLLPRQPIRIAAGLLFLAMAAVVIRQNLRRKQVDQERQVELGDRRTRNPMLTAFLVVFIGEWGDLTQLATAALRARYNQPVIVFFAATLALWSVSSLAAYGSLSPTTRPGSWRSHSSSR